MIRLFLLFLALIAIPARAAEVVYPSGSRLGLAPPSGMSASTSFLGFEDAGNSAAIILVSLPANAFAELDRNVTAEALKRQGVALETREPFSMPFGKAFLVIGRQDVENTKIRKWILVASSPTLTALVTVQMPVEASTSYPDAAIRTSLATLAVRESVPVEEQLSLLPFRLNDLADFLIAGVVPGRAVMLSDARPDSPPNPATTPAPHFFIAIAPGAPAQTSERDPFARDALAGVPNLKDVHITASEPLRMHGQQGHQIFANARDPAGVALQLVQWLRFGASGYLQMVGIAREADWKDAYPRFRTVRDGIEPR